MLPHICLLNKQGPWPFTTTEASHLTTHHRLKSNSCFFADDSVILLNSIEEIPNVLSIYEKFKNSSNLDVSMDKSSTATNYLLSPEELLIFRDITLPTDGITNKLTFLGCNISTTPPPEKLKPLARKEKSKEANTELPEDIKTLDNKIERFTNTFNNLYLQQVGLERCARIYLQSLALFYSTNHHPSKEYLDIPQKRLDAFVRKGKAYTRGLQRYLPSSLGGSGTPNIEATFLASKSFFLLKFFSHNKPLSTQIPNIIMDLLNFKWSAVAYASSWEINTFSKVFRKMDFSSGQTSVKLSRPSENLSTHSKTQTIKKTLLLRTPQIRHTQNEYQL